MVKYLAVAAGILIIVGFWAAVAVAVHSVFL
jgi:hypothetical protein